jgi:hypothetical protein
MEDGGLTTAVTKMSTFFLKIKAIISANNIETGICNGDKVFFVR